MAGLRRIGRSLVRSVHKNDLSTWFSFLAVVGVGGSMLVVIGQGQVQGPDSVWSNGWFMTGVVIVVVTVVLAAVLFVLARFNVPKLRLAHEFSPEFDRPQTISAPVAQLAAQHRTSVLSHTKNLVRVDETRGVEARRVQVRLAACDPPNPAVRTPTPLLWAFDRSVYGDVPAAGHAYVELFDVIDLANGTRIFGGNIPGLADARGVTLKLTLEVWWEGTLMDSLAVHLRVGDPEPSVAARP